MFLQGQEMAATINEAIGFSFQLINLLSRRVPCVHIGMTPNRMQHPNCVPQSTQGYIICSLGTAGGSKSRPQEHHQLGGHLTQTSAE